MSVGNVSNSSGFVDASTQGFNGLTADDFFKLLIAQLQNQDPTEPVGNDQLLQQLATMRNLQSNTELGDTLKRLSDSLGTAESRATEQLSVGASYIGKSVTLDDSTVGIVDRALSEGGEILVGVNGADVPLSRVVSVNTPASFLNQLVAVDTGERNQLGEQVIEYGVVTKVDQSVSPPVVTLQHPDAGGDATTSTYSSSQVTNLLTNLIGSGVPVTVVDRNGQKISGTPFVTRSGGGRMEFNVDGAGPFTLDRIVSVGG
jgi:flagellar basal-body rod modification protein FlgD